MTIEIVIRISEGGDVRSVESWPFFPTTPDRVIENTIRVLRAAHTMSPDQNLGEVLAKVEARLKAELQSHHGRV